MNEAAIRYGAGENDRRQLTDREVEILSVIAQGHSSQDVANSLCVSKRTVDFHLANAYTKLRVSNRIQAIQVAVHLGLLRGGSEFGMFRAFRDAVERSSEGRGNRNAANDEGREFPSFEPRIQT